MHGIFAIIFGMNGSGNNSSCIKIHHFMEFNTISSSGNYHPHQINVKNNLALLCYFVLLQILKEHWWIGLRLIFKYETVMFVTCDLIKLSCKKLFNWQFRNCMECQILILYDIVCFWQSFGGLVWFSNMKQSCLWLVIWSN